MKAWRIEKHGDLSALSRKDIPSPEPGPSEVRIQVEAVGLNHLDLWVRKGVEGHTFPLPITPGCDITGKIEKFGAGAKEALSVLGLSMGDPVVLNPGVSCGVCAQCLGGFDPLCKKYGILGEHRDGGSADFVVVPAANLVPRPRGLAPETAASVPIAFLTAWTMVFEKARVVAGELALVQAGGSGVSVAAIQMLKMAGAQVITTVGSEKKAELAKKIGADHVILYHEQDLKSEVKKIAAAYGKKGCELVIDHVGQETWADSMRCLSWGGRIVTCGATSGSDIGLDLKAVFFKNLSILGSTMGSKAHLSRILSLIDQGKLTPVISQVLSMEQYPEACRLLEERSVFGKIVAVNS